MEYQNVNERVTGGSPDQNQDVAAAMMKVGVK